MEKDELNIEIGQHLASLRRAKKIKGKDIAKMLGITPTTYSLVETGKIDLTYYRICQLAQILDVETYEILGYDPNNICAVKTQQLRAEMKEYQDKVISLQDEVYTLHQKILYQQRKKKLK